MGLFEQWDTVLPQFPKWTFGGHDIELDEYPGAGGRPYYGLQMRGVSYAELEQYWQLLKQNGFKPAGDYPSDTQLYKTVGGVTYNFSSDDAFAAGEGNLGVMLGIREPGGSFY